MASYLDSVPFSGIIRIRDMMYSVADPYRLDQGDVSFDAPDSVKTAMARAIADNHSHYVQTTGIPRLRELIAEKLRDTNGIPIDDVEDVLVTNGGIHGLYILCLSLLDPGDEVLIPDPAWPPAAGNILAARGVPVGYRLHESNGWQPDLDEIEAAITPKTRVLYLNSPSNPTGGVLTRAYLERLAAIAHEARPLGDLGRSLRGRRLRGRARQHRVAAGHVRAHDSALHVQQVVRDDRPAARLHRDPRRDDPRPREEDPVLHREQRRVGRAVRRHRRARGTAGLHRDVPHRAARAARSVLPRASRSRRAACSPASRRPARSTRSCGSIRRGADGRSTATASRVSWRMVEYLIKNGRIGCVPGVDFGAERRGLRAVLLRARSQGTDRRARLDEAAVRRARLTTKPATHERPGTSYFTCRPPSMRIVSPVMKSLSSSASTPFAISISPPQRPSGVASSTALTPPRWSPAARRSVRARWR